MLPDPSCCKAMSEASVVRAAQSLQVTLRVAVEMIELEMET